MNKLLGLSMLLGASAFAGNVDQGKEAPKQDQSAPCAPKQEQQAQMAAPVCPDGSPYYAACVNEDQTISVLLCQRDRLTGDILTTKIRSNLKMDMYVTGTKMPTQKYPARLSGNYAAYMDYVANDDFAGLTYELGFVGKDGSEADAFFSQTVQGNEGMTEAVDMRCQMAF